MGKEKHMQNEKNKSVKQKNACGVKAPNGGNTVSCPVTHGIALSQDELDALFSTARKSAAVLK